MDDSVADRATRSGKTSSYDSFNTYDAFIERIAFAPAEVDLNKTNHFRNTRIERLV